MREYSKVELLQKLYNSEINVSLESFWDGGIQAKIGDNMNGFKSEENHATFEDAAQWCWDEAKRLYPDAEAFKIN